MMLKRLCSVTIIICLYALPTQAQEILCKVRVMHDKIQNVDKSVFRGLENSITEFINLRKWTGDQFNVNEKIEMNILFNLTKVSDGDVYSGTMNISASRPIFNSSYSSTTVSFVDRDVIFRYSQFTPITYDDNRVSGNDAMASNLTALIAYYSYLVLGLDYDSFEKNKGQDMFKKAQNVVNNAPEQGKSIPGWRPSEDNKNRYWIVDQLLSPRFKTFREYWYTLHREGLDNMYNKPEEARKAITDGIIKLSQLQRENPGAILLQFFFNAKSDELLSVIAQLPKDQRTTYITLLQQMDVPNAQKYNSLK